MGKEKTMNVKVEMQIAKKLDMNGMEFQELLGKIERLSARELTEPIGRGEARTPTKSLLAEP